MGREGNCLWLLLMRERSVKLGRNRLAARASNPGHMSEGNHQQSGNARGAQRGYDPPADLLTLIAIAIVAYVLANLLHEGLGHGGACLLTGGKPLVLSTVHFECEKTTRFIAAAGTLVNLAAGFLCLGLLRVARGASPCLRYFLWLSMTINLLQAGGYFLFSGVANIGDWAVVVEGLAPSWIWRLGLIVLGIVSYLFFVWLSLLEMRPFIGSDDPQRLRRARRLALVPYFTGGMAYCIPGFLNPVGIVLVAISAAAASFGGTSGLAWMTEMLKGNWIPKPPPGPPLPIPRNWGWIAYGGVLFVFFVAVLGPGVHFPASGAP
jgi:hypothetical protein